MTQCVICVRFPLFKMREQERAAGEEGEARGGAEVVAPHAAGRPRRPQGHHLHTTPRLLRLSV